MIRPVSFGFNEQTAGSNAFQVRSTEQLDVQQKALAEFDALVNKLRSNGIDVIVIHDTPQPHTPDSIFPNNWISFHEDGKVFLYPMQAENRRLERRTDVINRLSHDFKISEVDDLSDFEHKGKFLEGTGSMVLDRQNNIAYACISPRTDIEVMNTFCEKSGYSPVYFHAVDGNEMAIYHTNVLMCIGEQFVVICLDTIRDKQEKEILMEMFGQTGKKVIEISLPQMNAFAGNMLELVNDKGEHLLVMSARAYHALTRPQVDRLEQYCTLIYSDLTVIENNGGGSARCMMAEVCLPLKINSI
jgi:hypothetical protein